MKSLQNIRRVVDGLPVLHDHRYKVFFACDRRMMALAVIVFHTPDIATTNVPHFTITGSYADASSKADKLLSNRCRVNGLIPTGSKSQEHHLCNGFRLRDFDFLRRRRKHAFLKRNLNISPMTLAFSIRVQSLKFQQISSLKISSVKLQCRTFCLEADIGIPHLNAVLNDMT